MLSEIVGDADTKAVFRRLLQEALQELIETELTATIGAAPHERTKLALDITGQAHALLAQLSESADTDRPSTR